MSVSTNRIKKWPVDQYLWCIDQNNLARNFLEQEMGGSHLIYAAFINYCNKSFQRTQMRRANQSKIESGEMDVEDERSQEEARIHDLLERYPMRVHELVEEMRKYYKDHVATRNGLHTRGLLDIDACKNDLEAIGKARDDLYHRVFATDKRRSENLARYHSMGAADSEDEFTPVLKKDKNRAKQKRRQARKRAAAATNEAGFPTTDTFDNPDGTAPDQLGQTFINLDAENIPAKVSTKFLPESAHVVPGPNNERNRLKKQKRKKNFQAKKTQREAEMAALDSRNASFTASTAVDRPDILPLGQLPLPTFEPIRLQYGQEHEPKQDAAIAASGKGKQRAQNSIREPMTLAFRRKPTEDDNMADEEYEGEEMETDSE